MHLQIPLAGSPDQAPPLLAPVAPPQAVAAVVLPPYETYIAKRGRQGEYHLLDVISPPLRLCLVCVTGASTSAGSCIGGNGGLDPDQLPDLRLPTPPDTQLASEVDPTWELIGALQMSRNRKFARRRGAVRFRLNRFLGPH